MCGRFTQHHQEDELVERFDISEVWLQPAPRYNIAPTQFIPAIIAQPDGRALTAFRWGLVPHWAKDQKLAAKMINARAETVADKAAYRTPLQRQRCLIPADGWYEWQKTEHGKQPYHFRRRDGGLFAFAGLWDEWRDPENAHSEPLRTCTIITGEANATAAPVHDRMPVILTPAHEAFWLDPVNHNTLELVSLLTPYPADEIEALPVSRQVNSPAVDSPELIAGI
ncbi:MAG: SOS response-associated peptidase [Blastocatellia bacterium]